MSISLHAAAINAVESMHAYGLARLAGVADPDSETSPGARFLTSVRDAFIDWVEYTRDDDSVETIVDRASEVACEETDSSVPVYTHELWKTFVDLCAYHDESAADFDEGTMTEQASYILANIAARLFVALASDYVSDYESARDEALGEGDD